MMFAWYLNTDISRRKQPTMRMLSFVGAAQLIILSLVNAVLHERGG